MTDETTTDDDSCTDPIDSLRSTLEFAKETEGSDRANALRAALGDAEAMDPEEYAHQPTVRETVGWAVSAPDEEVPFYVNQALEEVDKMEEITQYLEGDAESDAGQVGEQLRRAADAHRALSDLRDLGLDEDAESSLLNAQEALDKIILQLALEYGSGDA